jgi:hypothetical protein
MKNMSAQELHAGRKTSRTLTADDFPESTKYHFVKPPVGGMKSDGFWFAAAKWLSVSRNPWDG